MAQSAKIIELLFNNSFDFYNNINFYAKNVTVSKEAIASVDFQTKSELATVESGNTLVGYQLYQNYSIFVFVDRVIVFENEQAICTITNSPLPFSFVDFVIYYTYLLAFQQDGTFLWVDLNGPANNYGINSSLRRDEDFLPSGIGIFSICFHSGFLVFSRTDGFLLWTKAAVTKSPSDWQYWISNDDPVENLSFASSYYALGEAVHLGSYKFIIGINFNVYLAQFVAAENIVYLSVNKYEMALGRRAKVCFTHDSAYMVTGDAIKVYSSPETLLATSELKSVSLDFVNSMMEFPCKRAYDLSAKVVSLFEAFDPYYVFVSTMVKTFTDGYLFCNGGSYYFYVENTDGTRTIYHMIFKTSYRKIGDFFTSHDMKIKDITDVDVDILRPFIYSETRIPQEGKMKFTLFGNLITFGFDVFPTKVTIKKTANVFSKNYTEIATISEDTYPYATFISHGQREDFELEFDGQFIATEMVLQ